MSPHEDLMGRIKRSHCFAGSGHIQECARCHTRISGRDPLKSRGLFSPCNFCVTPRLINVAGCLQAQRQCRINESEPTGMLSVTPAKALNKGLKTSNLPAKQLRGHGLSHSAIFRCEFRLRGRKNREYVKRPDCYAIARYSAGCIKSLQPKIMSNAVIADCEGVGAQAFNREPADSCCETLHSILASRHAGRRKGCICGKGAKGLCPQAWWESLPPSCPCQQHPGGHQHHEVS